MFLNSFLDKRSRKQNTFKLGTLNRKLKPQLKMLVPTRTNVSLYLQVNARNAERALNQEKLESSKLREKYILFFFCRWNILTD